ncbi:hypothetical protein E2C01_097772 [Portunus trituberculatus]|uniref:Uncharacterized protein n=1 Tax=Portunus trituberculatus TaxID=210409 RepID=A0A5B7KC90_PORTR|nr:hypothetical protein [Portunus trituberculatus]
MKVGASHHLRSRGHRKVAEFKDMCAALNSLPASSYATSLIPTRHSFPRRCPHCSHHPDFIY